MIGIFLRSDVTQLVRAVRRKNMLHVVAAEYLPPYLEYVQKRDAGFLVNLFREVNQVAGSLYDEIYIVLPDGEFDFFDCGDFSEVEAAGNWEEAHAKWLADRNIRSSAYYVSYPIAYRTNIRHLKTSIGIAKDKIDCLLAAAKEADVSLLSVEPSGLAYLRCLGKWREEHCILEFFGEDANILAYSPIGGLFRLPMPQIARLREGIVGQVWEETIGDALVQYDAIAQKTFEFSNINVPVHVLSPLDLTWVESLRRRMAAVEFPNALVKTDLSPEEELEFMVPIGATLQVFEKDAFFQEDIPVFLRLASANVLPSDIKLNSRFARIKKKTLQYSKTLIGVLLVSLAIEGGGILYFSSIQIPEKLQNDHDRANSSIAMVKKELEIIKQGKLEHQYPLEALAALIEAKPRDLGFAHIEFGRAGGAGKQWITLNAVAADPMQLREYTARLAENSLFGGANIQQISTENRSGQKTATIEIGRGKI